MVICVNFNYIECKTCKLLSYKKDTKKRLKD